MLEIDGGVGVDEPERDALRQAGVHRCVVLMTKPLESVKMAEESFLARKVASS